MTGASNHRGSVAGAGPAELVDAEARADITGDIGRSLFVEAGAGSGKTSSLVDRVVTMVESGVPVASIAAITFTEAAARELRTRVRDVLTERGYDGAMVESAAFTTLHGFALRILSDFPIEAGLPPGFGVIDEVSSTLQFERDWRDFEGRLGDDMRLLELQRRAAALDVKLQSFSPVARKLDDNWDLLPADRESDHGGVELCSLGQDGFDLDSLVADVSALHDLRRGCLSDDDRLSMVIERVVESARTAQGQTGLNQLEILRSINWAGASSSGRKGNWRDPSVEEVRAAVTDTSTRVKATIDLVIDDTMSRFTDLVTGHVLDRVEHRRAGGTLAFHDLLVLTRRLLRSNELVRAQLHDRYRYLLLDEFQDTDPIQIELAVLIASSQPPGRASWSELASGLEPGRLVVVGDPKQSIYRFRRADMSVYSETERVLVPETTRLVSNFRSVPAIVDWINAFFTKVMGEGSEGVQPAYTPLAAVRAPGPTAHPAVVVLGDAYDSKEVKVGRLRQEEAEDVAALVCRIMEEKWTVQRDGEWKPPRLSDIAVLIPSRLSLPALEAAFAATGVPFRPETNSLVYATQEVRDVLAAIRAVVDPTSVIDVVATVRSGLFSISDLDLLNWKLAGGGFDYRVSDPPDGQAGSPLVAAFDQLRTWHNDRWWVEPAMLVDRVVRERRLRELALADPRPRDRWRRYRFLAEQAREFTETQGGDLQDFVDWVEIQSSDIARIIEPVPPEPDDDAVRILTVHGSKGLEFPIAVLAGAPSQEVGRRSGPTAIFGANGEIEVKLGGANRTVGFDARASVEEVLDANERIRLQYVAATRARDRLAVCVHHNDYGNSTGRRTWGVIQEMEHLWTRFERRGDEQFQTEPPRQLSLPSGGFEQERAAWLGQCHQLTAETESLRWTASGLADLLPPGAHGAGANPAVEIGTEPEALNDLDDRGGFGAEFGDAVHTALQQIDFERPDLVDAVAKAAAGSFGLHHLADEVADRVRFALAADTIRAARTLRHWREMDVAVHLDSDDSTRWLEGVVDLVIEGPDGLVVVDYKTDALGHDRQAGIAAKAARYRNQLAVYALALERVTGQPVAECRLLFLTPDGAVEHMIADLPQAMASVESLVTSPAGRR